MERIDGFVDLEKLLQKNIEEYITNLPEEIEKQDDNDFKQILEAEYEKFKSTYSAGYTKNNFELIWHAR